MSTLKYNTWLNTDNTENYKCRAWVNFNGTGTVAIRASGNVSSITDNGTGDYTVNFTNAMADANYTVIGNCNDTISNWARLLTPQANASNTTSATRVTTSEGYGSGNRLDHAYVAVAVFR